MIELNLQILYYLVMLFRDPASYHHKVRRYHSCSAGDVYKHCTCNLRVHLHFQCPHIQGESFPNMRHSQGLQYRLLMDYMIITI